MDTKTKESSGPNFFNQIFRKIFTVEENLILFVFIVLIAFLCIILPRFRDPYNLLVVSRQFSLITIAVIGQTVVLISGGFDLSIAGIVTLSAMVAGYMLETLGWPVGVAVIGGTLLGTLCGLFNGFLVGRVRINPVIATLGSGWIFTGIVFVITHGFPISKLPDAFIFLGQGRFLGIYLPIWLMLTAAVIVTLFLSKTRYGRYIFAVGGNSKASRLAGLNIANYRLMAYGICGTLTGFAGVVLAARLGSIRADIGANWTLITIASAVVGGVSITGGKGRIYGAVVGAALIGIIANALVLLHVSTYWTTVVTGLVLLLAVGADSLRRYREGIED
jgi:ribose transport system permease protein